MQIDIKKSQFGVTATKFLGFIISTSGISVDPEKTEAINKWPVPLNVKGTQAFLGFCNFYRRFVKDYGRIAFPLTRLTKKEAQWKWEEEEQEAFRVMKAAITASPVLIHFDPDQETVVETDASYGVCGGVMSQKWKQDGLFHPVAFYSKTMSATEMGYDIHDNEMLAIHLALVKWAVDLQSLRTPFLIITDHRALEYFGTKRVLNDRQLHWTDTLTNFHYKITYRPGKENHQADALTRKASELKTQKQIREASRTAQLLKGERLPPGNQEILAPVEVPPVEESAQPPEPPPEEPDHPQGHELVDQILEANRTCRNEATEGWWLEAEQPDSPWKVSPRGLLTRHGALYVPEGRIRTWIIEEVHARLVTAHPGRDKTKKLLATYYYWPGMTTSVATYLQNCRTCRRTHEFRD